MRTVLLVLAIALSGCGEEAPGSEKPAEGLWQYGPVAFAEDSLGVELSQPLDVAYWGGSIAIADGGNNRVIVFGPSGVTSIGGAGSGPGELRSPSSVFPDGDNLYVVDAGNGRLNLYSRSGEILATHPLPSGAMTFAAWAGDVWWGLSEANSRLAMSMGGELIADSQIPADVTFGRSPWARLVAANDSELFVLDNILGNLYIRRLDGSLSKHPLPADDVAAAGERRSRRYYPAPQLFGDLSITEDGRAFILTLLDGTVGYIFDPYTESFDRVTVTELDEPLFHASGVLVSDHQIYAVGRPGLWIARRLNGRD